MRQAVTMCDVKRPLMNETQHTKPSFINADRQREKSKSQMTTQAMQESAVIAVVEGSDAPEL
jgi:hypothetical protein